MNTIIPNAPFTARHITETNLCGWIGQALPGDMLEYHRGSLVRDVSPQNKRHGEAERAELLRIARRAWWAFEVGLVHLVQRRHRDDDYSYLIIARCKPRSAATSQTFSRPLAESA